MAIQQFSPGSIQTLLSTQLNNLANNTLSSVGAQFDNGDPSHLFPSGFLELLVTFGTNPSAGGHCIAYLLPLLDGTNQATLNEINLSPMILGVFPLAQNTSAQRIVVPCSLVIPPCPFVLALSNRAGQSFPASGSTVRWLPNTMQVG